jgi:hypothetical protein
MAKDDAESVDLAGELVAPHIGTQFRMIPIDSGIRCGACEPALTLSHLISRSSETAIGAI